MTNYNSTPLPPYPQLLQPGIASYAFGSKNSSVPPTRMKVTKVALTSNVATITGVIVEGNIPAVGSLVTITGTSQAGGAFNVTNLALTGVTIVAATGIGTYTFALTHSDVVAIADFGDAYVAVPEVAEALGVNASQAFGVQHTLGRGYAISWAYTCPSNPAAIAIQLEGAINDKDSEYTIIGTSQTTTSGYNEVIATVPENVNFVRLHVTSTSGGSSPTIIGKILQS